MTTQATTPPSRAVLGWMQAHPRIRAQLRFVAEALAGSAAGGRRERLAALVESLRHRPGCIR